MKRKIIAAALTMIGIFLIGFSIMLFLGLFKKQKAGILIDTDPKSVVYIDGKNVGNTPYEAEINPKEVIVKIIPESIDEKVLDDYETKINLVSGVKTIIKRDFREDEDYSSGAIVSFEKAGSKESFVTIVSIPDNAQVLIDGKIQGYTPLRISVPGGDHELLIIAKGYLEKTLSIRVYKGYKLTAFVKLAKISTPEPTPIPVLSETTVIKEQIKINKTDIGYLRVRGGAGVGFPEVGQVEQGEVYEVIETGENGKWYKISFEDKEGWVSSDFVTKLYIPVTETPE